MNIVGGEAHSRALAEENWEQDRGLADLAQRVKELVYFGKVDRFGGSRLQTVLTVLHTLSP